MFGLGYFTDTEDKEVDSHICCHSMEVEPLLSPGVLQPDHLSLHQEGVSPPRQEIFPLLMLCKASVSYRPRVPPVTPHQSPS